MMIFIVASMRLKGSDPFIIPFIKFTNMSALMFTTLMFTTSMLILFLGLVSEQITTLMYKSEMEIVLPSKTPSLTDTTNAKRTET